MMTPDELAARSRRAVDAATEAGRGLGLEVTDPVVLYDVFSVVVHLAPAPVVVRVPTVLPRCSPPGRSAPSRNASSPSPGGWPRGAIPSSRRARWSRPPRSPAAATR